MTPQVRYRIEYLKALIGEDGITTEENRARLQRLLGDVWTDAVAELAALRAKYGDEP